MKEKAIIFLAGLLLGAFISTCSIYVYSKANGSFDRMQPIGEKDQSMRENIANPPDSKESKQN